MPHSFGYRARTRDLYSKKKGDYTKASLLLESYKRGDYVDIKCNSSVQKGMPFKFYHGKTGRIWNISKRSVGIEVFKRVRNRLRRKKISVRIEHIRKSKCQLEHRIRVKNNELQKRSFRASKEGYLKLKRRLEESSNDYFLKK